MYDENGRAVLGRFLGYGTDWRSGDIVTINGNQYYQVSTQEFVRISDVIRIK
ncbi:SLAP domain-containing protein [Bombilactobacillus mellis]|nr:SLAP domain-containing protein [Bombilactobacillus mellis]